MSEVTYYFIFPLEFLQEDSQSHISQTGQGPVLGEAKENNALTISTLLPLLPFYYHNNDAGLPLPTRAVVGVAAHLTLWVQSQAWTVWGGIADWPLQGTWLHLQKQLVTEALGRWPLVSAQAPSAPTTAAPRAKGTCLLLRSST